MLRRAAFMFALAIVFASVTTLAQATTNDIPKNKHTVLGKYLTAKEAYQKVTADRGKVLFLDIRTSGEAMFVGNTAEMDALIPFVELKQPTIWDEKNKRFALVPNVSFVTGVDAALEEKGLSKADAVYVMCRSGDRSAKAVNILAGAGYTNAWSVYDGFEGDPGTDGRRTRNGWKNSGLPWSYKLDKAKVMPDPPSVD